MTRLTIDEKNLYQRHFAINQFTEEHQLRLKNSSVLVVGVGGLGSPITTYLAAAGIGKIGIIDDDIVSISNLQRQVIYSFDQLDKKKVLAAKERLTQINPYCIIETYDSILSENNASEIISHYDIVVDGTDNFKTRKTIDKITSSNSKPYVYGSINEFTGQVSVFNYQNCLSYSDLFPDSESVSQNNIIGVMGFVPGIIGSIQVGEVIKIITGIGETLSGKLLIFDALKNQYKIVNIK